MTRSRELEQAYELIRDVPDFPKPGIVFKDITPLLSDPAAMTLVVEKMAEPWKNVDLVCGMESRGFIFGSLLAQRLNLGFVPVRKPGKLPYESVSVEYELEYGTDTLEIHKDACAGKRVLICDDLLATGGTAAATASLIEKVGGEVAGFSFAVELSFLKGRERIAGQIESLFIV